MAYVPKDPYEFMISLYAIIRLIFIGFIIFFAPGILLYRFIFKEDDFSNIELLPIYFCLSISVISGLGLLAYLGKYTIETLLFLISFLILIFLILIFFKKTMPINITKSRYISNGNRNLIFLGVICIIYFLIMLGVGGELKEDGPFHLLLINKLALRSHITLENAYYKDYGIDVQYPYSVCPLSLSSLSKFSSRNT